MDMAERDWCQASLEYVFLLQAVQERKKFELVETLLCFVFGWWTFYHQAHEVHREAEPDVRDLQLRIQRTRGDFEETSRQTESLMRKMMEVRQTSKEDESATAGGSRCGHVMMQERKAFGNAWSKHYAAYDASSGTMRLVPLAGQEITLQVTGARLCTEPVERRFCWEVLCKDRAPIVLQATSNAERTAWLRALTAPEETRGAPPEPESAIDEEGFAFVRACIAEVEARGLGEQGLYRVAGVASRAQRLVADRERRLEGQETRTITSALKGYLRSLPEPLLTSRLHAEFVSAAKLEPRARLSAVSSLVRLLPESNRAMLGLVLDHLRAVAAHSSENLMTTSNLAVCFGPTLLRPPRETVASILDLKFCNALVETLLDHWPTILDSACAAPPPVPALPSSLATLARLDSYGESHRQLLHQLHREDRSASGSPPCAPCAPTRVRTLYACLGESEGELSFEPNQIITDVFPSGEPGWLRGTLDGRAGLVPANYVQRL